MLRSSIVVVVVGLVVLLAVLGRAGLTDTQTGVVPGLSQYGLNFSTAANARLNVSASASTGVLTLTDMLSDEEFTFAVSGLTESIYTSLDANSDATLDVQVLSDVGDLTYLVDTVSMTVSLNLISNTRNNVFLRSANAFNLGLNSSFDFMPYVGVGADLLTDGAGYVVSPYNTQVNLTDDKAVITFTMLVIPQAMGSQITYTARLSTASGLMAQVQADPPANNPLGHVVTFSDGSSLTTFDGAVNLIGNSEGIKQTVSIPIALPIGDYPGVIHGFPSDATLLPPSETAIEATDSAKRSDLYQASASIAIDGDDVVLSWVVESGSGEDFLFVGLEAHFQAGTGVIGQGGSASRVDSGLYAAIRSLFM